MTFKKREHKKNTPHPTTHHMTYAVGVGAIAMLMKTDVRTSASMLRRNLRHIRSWMEETAATTTRYTRVVHSVMYDAMNDVSDYTCIYNAVNKQRQRSK